MAHDLVESEHSRRGHSKISALLVTDYGYPAGGAEVFVQALKSGLKARGHTVRVFASNAGAKDKKGQVFANDWCRGTTSRFRTLLQSANPWALQRLKQVIKDFNPNIVHLNIILTQLSPMILDALDEIPVLYSVHWYRPVCMTGLKRLPDGTPCSSRAGFVCLSSGCVPLRDWLPLSYQMSSLRRKSGRIGMTVTCSQTMKKRLIQNQWKVDRVIQYGVQNQTARPLLHGSPRVAFVSRLVEAKGGDVMLRAFREVLDQVPEALLEIYGDGPERERLEGLANFLGISHQTEFHGHLDRASLEHKLRHCWVQAAPSLWEEPLGLVALEAAMRGTAVVASNYGGFRETVLDGRTGLLVTPGDPNALCEALLSLLTDRDGTDAMGLAARNHALANFSSDRMIEQYEQAYYDLLA